MEVSSKNGENVNLAVDMLMKNVWTRVGAEMKEMKETKKKKEMKEKDKKLGSNNCRIQWKC